MIKKLLFVVASTVLMSGCVDEEKNASNRVIDYKQEMRNFVQNISKYAKAGKPNFIIIPQNGPELLTENGQLNGTTSSAYIQAIDGVGREDLFYGYNNDYLPTPVPAKDHMMSFLDLAKNNGLKIMVIDYCSTQSFVDDAYLQNAAKGFVSFAADHRELDNIPAYPANPFNMHSSNITSLSEAKNFLFLINPNYSNKKEFINALRNSNYDLLFIDAFLGAEILTFEEIASLKTKNNGASRLVIAYLSIGEAEDYRYYWQDEWKKNPPRWLAEENPNWPGNYKVSYWDPDWQKIVYGNDRSYLNRIIDAGFDGVYLDIIDAFEYFENQ